MGEQRAWEVDVRVEVCRVPSAAASFANRRGRYKDMS